MGNLASRLAVCAVSITLLAIACGDDGGETNGGGGTGANSADAAGAGGDDSSAAGSNGSSGEPTVVGAAGAQGGSSEAGQGGAGATGEARLVVDLTFSTLLPGEQEFVNVRATVGDGNDDVSVASSDEDVVTASIAGSALVIQAGSTVGEATITVTSGAGLSRKVDVVVSDPRAIKLKDDLLIGFVDDFSLLYWDQGSGAGYDGSFWAPKLKNGFVALGHLGTAGYGDPSTQHVAIVAKALKDDALAAPTDYTLIWDTSGAAGDMLGAFWHAKCPQGYKALGAVVSGNTQDKPSLNAMRCVRSDLVELAGIGDRIWDDHGSGADTDFSAWQIVVPPNTQSSGTVQLLAGGFVGNDNYGKPSSDPDANMLRLEFPMARDYADGFGFPELHSFLPPEDTTPVQQGTAIYLPYFCVSDPARSLDYKIKTSPFYRLERDVYYRRLAHYYNQTGIEQDVMHSVTSGVSQEKSESFSVTTGISVTVSGGIGLISASTTVSIELGYSTETSIGEFKEESLSKDLIVPAHSAGALWQLVHRFTLKRRNGNVWETVGDPWEIGINSFVVDQYPD